MNHGSDLRGAARVKTQKINAIQMSRPGIPSSAIMRAYSFSIITELTRRSCRK